MRKALDKHVVLWRENDSLADEGISRKKGDRRNEESLPATEAAVWVAVLALLAIVLVAGFLLWAKTR